MLASINEYSRSSEITLDIAGNKSCGETYNELGGHFDAAGLMTLTQSIKDNKTLSCLRFSGDKDSSMPVSISTNSVTVDMSEKVLGVSGALILAAFLPRCTALFSLKFSGDYDDSVPVELWSTMTSADLSSVMLGMSGAIVFTAMIPKFSELQTINLIANGIPLEERKKIEKIFAPHPSPDLP